MQKLLPNENGDDDSYDSDYDSDEEEDDIYDMFYMAEESLMGSRVTDMDGSSYDADSAPPSPGCSPGGGLSLMTCDRRKRPGNSTRYISSKYLGK